jgi:uncharacterized spore protein YtfJ
MNVTDIMTTARDSLSVKRVFGEPYERDGVVVIPVASVAGGGGGGGGEIDVEGSGSEVAPGSGSGGGFGGVAKPAGVYVISGDTVKWQPAVDVNRIILGGQVVAVVFLLVLRSVLRRR